MGLMTSWVDSANSASTPFPLNNLPCGVFSRGEEPPHCGMAIGDFVADLTTLEAEGLVRLAGGPLLDVPFWNEVMEAGPSVWADLRRQVTGLLKKGASKRFLVEDHLVPLREVTLHLPFIVAEFTDFFSGRHHAEFVARLALGPEGKPADNWRHMPVGCPGRAASVVVSGTGVRRPWGQARGKGHDLPVFQPSRRFDFELEIGAVVGVPSSGPISVAEADAMIFGYVLLNDWSARDIQAWESQPFGPFQAKSAGTTISPWLVMAEALAPFRRMGPEREVPLLPHLQEPGPLFLDLQLEVALAPAGGAEAVISRTNAQELYFASAQQLAHHASAGGPMSTGDLLGSGTISGAEPGSQGCLLELSQAGKAPIAIAGGTRSFLQDHDRVTLRGQARGEGYVIGFGDCAGEVLPALADPFARKG